MFIRDCIFVADAFNTFVMYLLRVLCLFATAFLSLMRLTRSWYTCSACCVYSRLHFCCWCVSNGSWGDVRTRFGNFGGWSFREWNWAFAWRMFLFEQVMQKSLLQKCTHVLKTITSKNRHNWSYANGLMEDNELHTYSLIFSQTNKTILELEFI